MELTQTETIEGMQAQYAAFADLVDSLTEEQWATPSRCDGFDVRDVAGHVIGLASDVAAGVPGSRNAEEEAASIRGLSPAEAAADLRTTLENLAPLAEALAVDEVWNGPSGVPDLTMAEGVLTLWYDTFVHADDIRAAIGEPSEAGPGLKASLAYLESELTKRSFGPARVVFADQDESFGGLAIGETDASTPTHRVDAHDFVLAATGRLDADALGLDPGVNIYAE
jgi:uncharacterized protein (TIGR03083 family)